MSKKIVYLPGVWDFLHEGHLNIIEGARRLADILIVGVVSDEGVEAYKGRKPFFDQAHRLRSVSMLRGVNAAILQRTTNPVPEIMSLLPTPNILVHGSDWTRLKEGHEELEKLGIQFVILPYTEGVSSTRIREKLCE